MLFKVEDGLYQVAFGACVQWVDLLQQLEIDGWMVDEQDSPYGP